MNVHCPTCQRREQWSDGLRVVTMEGGQRRPAEAPELAAWRILRATMEGSDQVVAICDGCDLPMTGPGTAVPWTFEVAGGSITVTASQIDGPDGSLTPERAEAILTERFQVAEPFEPGMALFKAGLISSLLAPFTLWVITSTILVFFIWSLVDML